MIVTEYSRLARSTSDLLRIVEELTKKGVQLVSLKENLDTSTPQGKYKGRKPIPFDKARFKAECAKWRRGEQSAVCTMRKFDMKPNRFYRKVKEMKENEE